MNLDEEEALLVEEQSLLKEQASLEEEQASIQYDPPEAKFAPDATRTEIPFDQTGISQGDIEQLESVNQRKLAQLQGVGSPITDFGDVSAQAASFAFNPIREFFGGEKVFPGNFINPIEGYQADETERLLRLAKTGVKTNKYKSLLTGKDMDVSAKARAIGSLGLKKEDKIQASRQELKKQFNTDVEVGIDPKTKEPVYLNPLNNRLYALNPAGLEAGDFTDYLGSGIVSVSETVAMVMAFRTGKVKSAKKEVAASAFGAAIGEGLKLTLGRALGTNKDVSYGDIAWEATKEGLIALGAGSLLEGLVSGARKYKTARAESIIPGHVLDSFKDDIDAINAKTSSTQFIGERAIKAVNKALRDVQSNEIVQPNVGQILGDSDVLDVVEMLKRSGHKEKKPLLERDVANKQGLQEYFTLINNNVTTTEQKGAFRLAEDIQAVTGKNILARLDEAKASANRALKLSSGAIQDIPAGSYMSAGRAAKGALTEEEKLFMEAANVGYTKLAKEAEAVNAIPDSVTMKLDLARLDSNQSNAKETGITKYLNEGVLDSDYEWTVTSITDTIKTLRNEARAMDTGVPNAASGKIKKALSILEDFKVRALKDHPDLLEKQLALDAVYAKGKEIFHEGIGKKILSTKDKLADSEIFSSIVTNGNSDTAKNVATAIKDKPEAMLSMKKAINRLYKKEVAPNGVADLQKHNAFIEKYVNNEIITPFLNQSEVKKIRRVGAAGKLAEFEGKKRDAAIQKINKMFDSKITDLEPGTLMNKIWGKDKEGNVIKLKKALADNPEIWKSVQAEVMNEIKKKITPLPRGTFSLKMLGETLRDREGPIKEILGESYFNNLTVLKDSLEVVTRKGEAFDFTMSNAFTDIARSYVGVFTREGRFITAANRYRSAKSRALLTEMVLDPEKIRKVSALLRARKGSDTAKLILTQLGASGLYHVGEDDMTEQDYRAYGDMIKQIKIKNKLDQAIEKSKIKKAKEKEINRLEEQQRTLQSYY